MQKNGRLRGRIGRALALLGMVETARAQGMDAADIGLLAVLASHADEGGAAHPSQSTLACEVGRERPWVNRRLAALTESDLGGHTAVEKTRHCHPKGGETSCRYRIPLMDLAIVGAAAAESSGDTPCAKKNHEQEVPHDPQKPLSPARMRPEREGLEIRGGEKVGAGWVPTAEDVGFAAMKRPDLTPADLLLLAEKLVAHHSGRLLLADASAVFRRWVLTERASHDRNHHRPRLPRREYRPSSSAIGHAASGAANRDKALAALTLLTG
jgi:hypothetical protein